MRYLLILFFCLAFSCISFSATEGEADFIAKTSQLKQEDKLEEFIYAHLDQFLLNPVPERLHLLEGINEKMWRLLGTKSEQLAMVILLCNQGYYLSQFNEVVASLSAYEEAWQLYDGYALEGFDITEYCLKPLGNAYTVLGDYDRAEKIIKSYLSLARNQKKQDHLTSAMLNLSIVYHSSGY